MPVERVRLAVWADNFSLAVVNRAWLPRPSGIPDLIGLDALEAPLVLDDLPVQFEVFAVFDAVLFERVEKLVIWLDTSDSFDAGQLEGHRTDRCAPTHHHLF